MAAILHAISERIECGLLVDAGIEVDLGDDYVVEFVRVHPSYLADGLLATWDRYYEWVGAPPGELRALQVVPPMEVWCDDCNRKRRRFPSRARASSAEGSTGPSGERASGPGASLNAPRDSLVVGCPSGELSDQ